MCAHVAPSGEYLRGHGRVAVDVTALRRLWQHSPVLGLDILACVPVYAVVVAVCQLLIKTIIIISVIVIGRRALSVVFSRRANSGYCFHVVVGEGKRPNSGLIRSLVPATLYSS